jgi:hypothetical protein
MMGEYEEHLRRARGVRSIQRVVLPADRDAAWMAETYFRWLQRFVWPIVVCALDDDGSVRIRIRGTPLKLLKLSFQPDRSDPGRRLYLITGGLLASRRGYGRGRMEFHNLLDDRYTIIAIHDFVPSLPWNFYQATQATFHAFVMRAFQRHVGRTAG